jgi:hypothetical protein
MLIGGVWLITSVVVTCFASLLTVGAYATAAMYWSEDTVYAPRYTEAGFESVDIGWERAAVAERLGEPLARDEDLHGGEWWSYSASAETGYYWVRILRFDAAGRVVEKVAEFAND